MALRSAPTHTPRRLAVALARPLAEPRARPREVSPAARFAALLAAGLGACNAVPDLDVEPATIDVSTTRVATTRVATTRVATTARFDFHSHALVNLHHFLYQAAQARARSTGRRVAGRPVEVTELAELEAPDGDARDAWRLALDFYDAAVVDKDLLFDPGLTAIKRALATLDDVDAAWPGELDARFADVWRRVWPDYRARFWPAHDRGNRAWIAAACAALERFEPELTARVASAFGGTWPTEPVRVDVTRYANWAGAYTTDDPPHVTLASGDADNGGDGALEVLVHEASHTDDLFGAMPRELGDAFGAHAKSPPADLWHLLIFFTAGECTARTLRAAGTDGYRHYGDRTGLYDRIARWRPLLVLLAEHWTRWLDGAIDRGAALRAIAAAASGG